MNILGLNVVFILKTYPQTSRCYTSLKGAIHRLKEKKKRCFREMFTLKSGPITFGKENQARIFVGFGTEPPLRVLEMGNLEGVQRHIGNWGVPADTPHQVTQGEAKLVLLENSLVLH